MNTKTLQYKRSHFATQLPVDYLYSASHAWVAGTEQGGERPVWRVGITKFASRMLGEMVDFGVDLEPGSEMKPGDIIGWLEGFKAISDLYAAASGAFRRGNPRLAEEIQLIGTDCYGEGWIYEVAGQPDERCMDVYAYRELLDRTIDKILEKQGE